MSGPGYELRDVPRRGAILVAVSFILVVALLLAGLTWWSDRRWDFNARPESEQTRGNNQTVPSPRLQIFPPADLSKLRALKDRRLRGLGWVDRNHGIVHIPIDRAMAIEVGRAREGG